MLSLRHPILTALAVIISTTAAFAQDSQSVSSSEGLELLTRVAKRYADAKSYYIESIEERMSVAEYNHSWQKTVLVAGEAPGDRYYFEGRSHLGATIRVTDGKTVWTYRPNEHHYTASPQPFEKPKVVAMPDMAMSQAEWLRRRLSDEVKSLKSAHRLPDTNLKINGRKVRCYVVHVLNADRKRASSSDAFDKTFWIDKDHQTILKVVEHIQTYAMVSGGASVPIQEDVNTIFTDVSLDGPVRDSLFSFVPPADAKLIEEFADPMTFIGGNNLTGEPAPALQFKSADGKLVALDSFRGEPVLIDIWATWCGPCLAALPKLAEIYKEARDKGLVLLSVDRDEDAKKAVDFLARKNYAWPDFHDDGEMEELIGSSGIPRTLLIDAKGKVVYDGSFDDDRVRQKIAKLGPEYASLQKKLKDAPCVASN
jgi:thiol-disulfide isomerase/thioredoxin